MAGGMGGQPVRYDDWARRERRRARLYAIAAWALLVLGAALFILVGWLALVGFLVVFG